MQVMLLHINEAHNGKIEIIPFVVKLRYKVPSLSMSRNEANLCGILYFKLSGKDVVNIVTKHRIS